eukprot:TRINITY_DN3379_c0_g2_i1.p1 TRINITY_DN3379_c0_g2~~TRINITY_DN3379_c0_g2_i1.p1  ORF type:complete len:454 (-),score=32.91 TRINITY_DN3379_c0_g2_i1:1841-3202(-)
MNINDSGNVSSPSTVMGLQQPDEIQTQFEVPKIVIGKVLGRGGATVQAIQAVSGVRIQIDQTIDPATVYIEGDTLGVQCAQIVVTDIATSKFKGYAFLRQAGSFVERVQVDPLQNDVSPPEAVYIYGRGYVPYAQITTTIHPSMGYHPPKVVQALNTYFKLRPQTKDNMIEYVRHKTAGGMITQTLSNSAILPSHSNFPITLPITPNLHVLQQQYPLQQQQQQQRVPASSPLTTCNLQTQMYRNVSSLLTNVPGAIPTQTSQSMSGNNQQITQQISQQQRLDLLANMIQRTTLEDNAAVNNLAQISQFQLENNTNNDNNNSTVANLGSTSQATLLCQNNSNDFTAGTNFSPASWTDMIRMTSGQLQLQPSNSSYRLQSNNSMQLSRDSSLFVPDSLQQATDIQHTFSVGSLQSAGSGQVTLENLQSRYLYERQRDLVLNSLSTEQLQQFLIDR